jgi:hypothetical protein
LRLVRWDKTHSNEILINVDMISFLPFHMQKKVFTEFKLSACLLTKNQIFFEFSDFTNIVLRDPGIVSRKIFRQINRAQSRGENGHFPCKKHY